MSNEMPQPPASELQYGTFTYGNNHFYSANRLSIRNEAPRIDLLELPKVTIGRQDYLTGLEDINTSWRVLEDSKTGKTFEIAVINDDLDASELADLEISTFSSSLLDNSGNAVEFAENAAAHPGVRRIYAASPGNGKTSYWEPVERKYTKKTGRFMDGEGRPLPTIAALARCLKNSGYVVSRLSTNSAGGAHATALMQAFPEGQVSHAYLKSRPNIVDHPHFFQWGMKVLIGDLLDDRKFQKTSRDEWRLTGEMIAEAKLMLPRLYDSSVPNLGRDIQVPGGGNHGLSKMWSDMKAFSRGSKGGQPSPAAHDTVQALRKQPDAQTTFHFPDADRLYSPGHDAALDFIMSLHQLGKTAVTRGVEALVLPGAHRDHTQYPSLRWSFENYAFARSSEPGWAPDLQ
jgi:hypothetical protein